MLVMSKNTSGDATLRDFQRRSELRMNRSVEPKNVGPTRYSFAKVVGDLAKGGAVHGTVLKRLKRKKSA